MRLWPFAQGALLTEEKGHLIPLEEQMNHLSLLQNVLKILGIPFTTTEERDSVHISGEREWYDHPAGGKAFR